jgi:hypothetical protein
MQVDYGMISRKEAVVQKAKAMITGWIGMK